MKLGASKSPTTLSLPQRKVNVTSVTGGEVFEIYPLYTSTLFFFPLSIFSFNLFFLCNTYPVESFSLVSGSILATLEVHRACRYTNLSTRIHTTLCSTSAFLHTIWWIPTVERYSGTKWSRRRSRFDPGRHLQALEKEGDLQEIESLALLPTSQLLNSEGKSLSSWYCRKSTRQGTLYQRLRSNIELSLNYKRVLEALNGNRGTTPRKKDKKVLVDWIILASHELDKV